MPHHDDRNSYKQIFKATALFGGVKIYHIAISIIRSKLVAMLIGPMGMGIQNIFSSTVTTVNHISGCGLQTSAVREVAKSSREKDQQKINGVITVLRFFVWITGLAGLLFVFIFSSYLSKISFGNTNYSLAFKFISIILLLTQINAGQIALLQGTFHYKEIAKSSLLGQSLSLLLTIPLYFFFRDKGIVPSLIIASFITLFFSWFYSKRIPYARVAMSLKDLFSKGKSMMTLGVVLALGSLIGNLSSYLMNLFLSNYGSISDVGLYGAGMAIANNYIFMVLSAMSTDYVPRIAAMDNDREGQIDAINKQTILVMTILLPLIVVFIIFSKTIIHILYSPEFYEIITMLRLFMVGMLFQAITWCLSYAIVARGDKKLFIITECYNFIVSISLKIVGFLVGGLTGIGVAFIIDYIFEGALIFWVCHKKFSYKMSKDFLMSFFVVFLFCLFAISITLIKHKVCMYALGTTISLLSLIYSIVFIDKRTGIISDMLKRLKLRNTNYDKGAVD